MAKGHGEAPRSRGGYVALSRPYVFGNTFIPPAPLERASESIEAQVLFPAGRPPTPIATRRHDSAWSAKLQHFVFARVSSRPDDVPSLSPPQAHPEDRDP